MIHICVSYHTGYCEINFCSEILNLGIYSYYRFSDEKFKGVV